MTTDRLAFLKSMVRTDACGGCGKPIADDDLVTEINPPGGYGRPQLLACDACMRAHFGDWRAEHWPNWPESKSCTV